jgi:hypothetical protein
MLKAVFTIIILNVLINISMIYAQGPEGKNFGFGIILGDPSGATVKFWTAAANAFVVDVGASYFGSPRIGVDYLWHFDAFRSRIANLYAGAGGALGIGKGNGFWYKGKYFREKSELGIAARGVFGVNVIPENTPLELFFEIGMLIGFSPDFGSSADAAIGIRFYSNLD